MLVSKVCKFILPVTLLLVSSVAIAADFDVVEAKLKTAMAAEGRPEKDIERDRNRSPIETLKFFGLRDNMKVVELIPGGGWYTRLLAPVLREKGDFYVALGTGRIEDTLLKEPGFNKVKVLAKNSKMYRPEGARLYKVEKTAMDVKNVDMVLTFRNYHNFDEVGRMDMNRSVYKALKPGGIYAVVDHSRRHMESDTIENRRRFDPVLAIKEIQSAGFELLDYTDLHFRPDDELRYEVGRKTVTGNTDRWALKFVKPK